MVTVTFSDDFKRDAVAQITERGYKRRPGSYGGKPSVVVDIGPVSATGSREPARPRPAVRRRGPGQGLGDGHHLHSDAGRLRLSRGGHRPLFPACDRLVDAKQADNGCRFAGPAYGRLAAQAEGKGADPFG